MSDSSTSRKDSLDACLGLAFGADPANSENSGQSVLQSLGHLMKTVPQVLLRDPGTEDAIEPFIKPDAAKRFERDNASRYRIDGEIAVGGMGKILKGRDTDLGRDLAVKVLLDKHANKPEVIQRFVEEAQIGGQLQHPGIAPVYELGQFADKRPFFTMKLVKGKTLAALLDGRKSVDSDRTKFIGIFEQVCQTMAYAHSRGVIHRDLKPANIMVGAFGEVQVMDWGLAKVLNSGGVADEKKANETHQDRSIIETLRSAGSNTSAEFGSQTQMGSVMGTPAYMPPEQALGEIDQLDQRADVFGLGAILCEILTGKPPYVADDSVKIFRLASRGKLDDCLKRLDDCNADIELVAIAKTAISAEPSDRPCDASVLAERISSHQEAVENRLRESEIDRAAQAVRADEESKRRRVSVALATSLLGLVLAVSSGVVWAQKQKTVEAEQMRNAADERARLQAQANESLRWGLYQSDIQRAQVEIDNGNYSTAKSLLMAHVPQQGELDLRGFEWHYLYRQCPRPARRDRLRLGDKLTSAIAGDIPSGTSHDGKYIAAVFTSSNAKYLAVWDTHSGRKVWSTGIDFSVDAPDIVLSRDGNLVGICTVGRESKSLPTNQSEEFLPEIRVWDINANRQIARITSVQFPMLKTQNVDFGFRPGSNSIALKSNVTRDIGQGNYPVEFSTNVMLWDMTMGKIQWKKEFNVGVSVFEHHTLDFSPDGKWFAHSHVVLHSQKDLPGGDLRHDYSEDAIKVIHLLDADTGEPVRQLRTPLNTFSRNFAFSPDSQRLAMAAQNFSFANGSYDSPDKLLVWDVGSGDLLVSTPTRFGTGSLKFSATGEYVVVGTETPEVFRVADGAPVMKIDNPQHGIVTFSADEQSLRSIGHDGVIADWKFPQYDLDESNPFVFGHLNISGNGKVFLRTHWGEEQPYKATFYDHNGRKVRETHIPLVKMWSPVELNHDGSKLLITHWDGGRCISVWDCERDELVGEMFRASETEQLHHCQLSPTESKVHGIVEVGEEGAPKRHELRLWNLDDSSMLRFTLDLEGIPTSSSYAPDGKTIRIVTSLDKDTENETDPNAGETFAEMSVRDVRTGKELRRIRVPGRLRSVRMSPDGKQFAGVNDQGKAIEIWDLASSKLRSKINLPKAAQIRLSFSPSGKRLLSMTTSQTEGEYQCNNVVTVWDSATGTQLLSRKYFSTGLPGWMGFEFVGDQHRLWIASLKGRALFWDGTPVDLDRN